MKKIYFIRHAKAKKEGESDFVRKLSERGKTDALLAAKLLKKQKILPDIIYTSAAKRALSTAKIISKELGFKNNLVELDELYLMTSGGLFGFIKDLDDENESVFVIGHNPTITEICEILSDSAIGHIPTCGIFGIEFDVEEFSQIKEHMGRVLMFEYPKKIEL
ncbi:SixA phosphatase family protein [Campylobacter geochelonis]|uniref:Phosphohistidine phosphatase SixA n=1 Tax=Campylobacter geochelonis TaxID=1780362 RepID=A0A128ERJ5_9BACT|nr:histidine phosphatase family protein [Campylobacter geochelonis]QKF71296.1 phosphohistidine phosphatase [Campylobacter geochelonis]CZE48100.1 phosphohistidine phosphatase SixA [Campylobacter geochelonis]CZE48170.1 phosphohistidine phosphatase SixA [Campylobacter geochelonis]CZE51085.1 phosphohistidine phosphatase SixA [Campylobacter geochelonis]